MDAECVSDGTSRLPCISSNLSVMLGIIEGMELEESDDGGCRVSLRSVAAAVES